MLTNNLFPIKQYRDLEASESQERNKFVYLWEQCWVFGKYKTLTPVPEKAQFLKDFLRP